MIRLYQFLIIAFYCAGSYFLLYARDLSTYTTDLVIYQATDY